MNGKILLAAAAAFLIPMAVVAVQNRDQISSFMEVDPSRGKLLYFTSPA
jgi:hypothetical protein